MLIIGYSRVAAPAGPSLVQLVASADGVNDGSANLLIPAGIAAGNTLVAAFKVGTFSLRTVASAPSGWTLADSDAGDMGFYVYRKTADGTEGGTTATWTMSASCNAAFVFAEVSGNRAVSAAFASATLDPPSHAPSAGSAPTIWIAVSGARRGDNEATAAPSGYSGLTGAASGSSSNNMNVRIAGAYKAATTASEDPGAFTWTGPTSGPQAATISVR